MGPQQVVNYDRCKTTAVLLDTKQLSYLIQNNKSLEKDEKDHSLHDRVGGINYSPLPPKPSCPYEKGGISRRKELLPGVQEGSPDTFLVVPNLKNKKLAKKHQKFKKGINMFCLDVLQRVVLPDGIQADKEVIETPMSFIVTKELPKDTEQGRTKKISLQRSLHQLHPRHQIVHPATAPPRRLGEARSPHKQVQERGKQVIRNKRPVHRAVPADHPLPGG